MADGKAVARNSGVSERMSGAGIPRGLGRKGPPERVRSPSQKIIVVLIKGEGSGEGHGRRGPLGRVQHPSYRNRVVLDDGDGDCLKKLDGG